MVNGLFVCGKAFASPVTISTKVLAFDYPVPAESFRGALVYPSLDVDRSTGPHRGRIYASWMDLTAAGTTDIFISYSDNGGASWSSRAPVADQLSIKVDRFNHWMSVDPVTSDVNVAFYDTRNDKTGSRYMTDYYLSHSKDGGQSWTASDIRVTNVTSYEHDRGGLFPFSGIHSRTHQGDYKHPVTFALHFH